MRRLLLAILAGMLGLTGTALAEPGLIGGKPADQAYPFAVSLHTTPSGKLFCAGALVDPSWVVTAAHCLYGKTPAEVTARLGTNDVGTGGEVAQPAEFVLNPAFDPDVAAADIALIHLAAPAKAAPIAIAAAAAPGTATRLIGWGQTCPTPGCNQLPTALQQLDTHIVEGSKCTARFDGTVELCTDNPGGNAGSCYGDSGSPQLVRSGETWQLVGITSRASTNDPVCATAPSVYTSVVAYAPWITGKIAPPKPS